MELKFGDKESIKYVREQAIKQWLHSNVDDIVEAVEKIFGIHSGQCEECGSDIECDDNSDIHFYTIELFENSAKILLECSRCSWEVEFKINKWGTIDFTIEKEN